MHHPGLHLDPVIMLKVMEKGNGELGGEGTVGLVP
jgi:hypothetical protein